ncbi:MAG: hypothetical protein OK438_01395 [Thaumarchaeota archaeon]|nr:hypothetical protein [Nitrososphaerota archaeon]
MNCEFCGKEEALPFVCNYCGSAICPDHRLPEAHQCKGDLSQRRTIVAPPQTTFSWQDSATSQPLPPPQRTGVFSAIEVRDILIAWLALGVAFSLALSGVGLTFLFGGQGLGLGDIIALFPIALVTVGSGFVLHELSHKFVAQRYGYWAEFRMWLQGLYLALITSLFGVIIAAPGATYISGISISRVQNGWISLAGPLTNVALAAVFLPVFYFGGGTWQLLGYLGVRINILLAAFNMLPLGPLDGAKVFRWSFVLWVLVFAPLAGAYVYTSWIL